MANTKITTDEIEALIRPAMEWLNNNCHPCVRITIEPDRFTVSEHVCSVPILDYVSRKQTETEISREIADAETEISREIADAETEISREIAETETEKSHEIVDAEIEKSHEIADAEIEKSHEIADAEIEKSHEIVDAEIEVNREKTEAKSKIRYEIADGVVLDHQTNLIWQENYVGPMSWYEAVAYPATLGPKWTLPTARELFELVDLTKNAPASTFPNMPRKPFWSSSHTCGSASSWRVSFDDGHVSYGSRSYAFFVRCVRNGPKKVCSY